jgi:hypothetical protein
MPLVIITVREHLFSESCCWVLQECVTLASQSAGWSAEPWAQKVIRLSAAEFTYRAGAKANQSAADISNFILMEVLLMRPRPTAEKNAFWHELSSGVESRLRARDPALFLRFVEYSRENFYSSQASPL